MKENKVEPVYVFEKNKEATALLEKVDQKTVEIESHL
jgi:hypothetical protein